MAVAIHIARPGGPGDATGIAAILARLDLARVRSIAVLGKVEGPATLNDFSRDLAIAATEAAIVAAGGRALLARTWSIFSTGCEGIASPLTIVMADIADGASAPARGGVGLAIGAARSAPLPAAERCGRLHVDRAADAVRQAMAMARLGASETRLVLVKSPVLSPNEASAAPGGLGRHAGSTAASRGAAALGAGVALGDVDAASLGADPVGRTSAAATRTMSFSGIEAECVEAIVLGERAGGDPAWHIETRALSDLLDWPPDLQAGLQASQQQDAASRIVLFKAGIPPGGLLRGLRTTVLTSDLTPDKQVRAAASGLIAARLGAASTFISAGAEHQGQAGSCLCALLRRTVGAA